ncbi:MAG: AsmA-like C-terminal domain-containing protein [Candidatus Binatia bacterium]
MRRERKLVFGLVGGLGFILLLVAVAALVVPHFAGDIAPLHAQIITQLSQELGGKVQFRTLRLSVLPLPHVSLDRVSLSFPGSVEGTVESIAVYPKLLPLVRGKVQVAELRLAGAHLRIRLPRRPGAGETPHRGSSVADVKQAVASALGGLASVATSQAPGLVVVLKNSTVSLSPGSIRTLGFTDVRARIRLPPDLLSLDITCASTLWERMSLNASLDVTNFEGAGRITVTRFRPQFISAQFLPHGTRLGDSEASLTLDVTAHGLDEINADVDASIPSLTVRRHHEKVMLRGQHVNATLRHDGNTTHATLTRWQLDHPRLQLSGSLSLAPDLATLEVQATKLDVTSVRQAATLVAEDVPLLRDIFNVLRGGTVPQITFRSTGASFSDLGRDETVVIQGRLVDGDVHVPGIDLDLNHVTGDAKVANGVLSGEQASAQLGKFQAAAGTLRLGLSGTAPELHVETQVQADAAELAALLKHLVKNDSFQREFGRITDVAGMASGKLLLGGSTKDVTVTADASAFDVSGRLQGTSLPLRVQGGRFVYAAGGIEASELHLTVGTSVLSQCDIQFHQNGTAWFEAAAGTSRIVLNEAYPWLLASGWLPDSSWNPQSLSGTLSVTSLRAGGPTAAPSDWRFELNGAAQALAIESVPLRERIAIRYPVSLSNLRLEHDTKAGTSFAAEVTGTDGLRGTVDVVWKAERLHIKRLHVRDAQSDAALTLLLTPQDLSLTFNGTMSKATLDKLIGNDLLGGSLRGDVHIRIDRHQLVRSTLEGRLEASDFIVPLQDGRRLRIEHIVVDATNETASVDGTVDVGWGSRMRLQGTINQSPDAFAADLDLTAGQLDWGHIEPWLRRAGDAGHAPASASWEQGLRGTLRVAAESFTYGGFTWQPARAALTFAPGRLTVTITEATVCGGIGTPGTIAIAPGGLTLAFDPTAKDAPLDALVKCVGIEKEVVTGQYGLTAKVAARGQAAALGRSIEGQVEFSAKSGRIYGMGLTAKVLSVLNVATGAVRNLSDLAKEGLPYDSITLKGDLKGGTLVLTEAILDGPSVTWAGEGSVDIVARTMDVTLLVAPLTTVDSVVSRIPVISGVLGGSLVSIPVKVTGSLDDPQVIPLSPSAVGKRLLGVMTRTLKLPFTLIQPLLPDREQR